MTEGPDLQVLPADEVLKLARLEAARSDVSGAKLLDLWLSGEHELHDAAMTEILPKLPLLFFERKRGAIAAKLGVRVGALDEIRHPGGNGKVAGQGRPVVFAETTPWPESVDGGQLLDDLAAVISQHVVMPAGAASAEALYLAFTHVYDLFDVCPLLAITSPTYRCGKTTNEDVDAELVPRPLRTCNISPAVLYRSIEKFRPTLLIDEADMFLTEKGEALRGLLNAGHTRGSAFALRCEGEDSDPAAYSTWGPKIVALIGRLPATLRDRSIEVRLQRKRPDEKTIRLDRRARAVLGDLRRQLARWAIDVGPLLQDIVETFEDTVFPEWLGDRQRDNWRGLLAIARAVDGFGDDTWTRRALGAIDVLERRDDADDDAKALLLRDLRDLFADKDRLLTRAILEGLHGMEERPWNEWGKDRKPLSACGLAGLIRGYGVDSTTLRDGEARGKGYYRCDFEEAWTRYLPLSPPPAAPGRDSVTDRGTDSESVTISAPDGARSAGKGRLGGIDAVTPPVTVTAATRDKEGVTAQSVTRDTRRDSSEVQKTHENGSVPHENSGKQPLSTPELYDLSRVTADSEGIRGDGTPEKVDPGPAPIVEVDDDLY